MWFLGFTLWQSWSIEDWEDDAYTVAYWLAVVQLLCLRISETLHPIFFVLGSHSMWYKMKEMLEEIFQLQGGITRRNYLKTIYRSKFSEQNPTLTETI